MTLTIVIPTFVWHPIIVAFLGITAGMIYAEIKSASEEKKFKERINALNCYGSLCKHTIWASRAPIKEDSYDAGYFWFQKNTKNIWHRRDGNWVLLNTAYELFTAATLLEPRYYSGKEDKKGSNE